MKLSLINIFETGSSTLCSSSMHNRSRILWIYSPRSGVPLSFPELTPAFSEGAFIRGTHHEYKSERANANRPRVSNGQLRGAVNACFLEPEPAHGKARNLVSLHSRSAWRIVIAKIDSCSVQLWRTRIVWRAQLAARRHQRRDRGDSLSYIQTVRDELVGVNGG